MDYYYRQNASEFQREADRRNRGRRRPTRSPASRSQSTSNQNNKSSNSLSITSSGDDISSSASMSPVFTSSRSANVNVADVGVRNRNVSRPSPARTQAPQTNQNLQRRSFEASGIVKDVSELRLENNRLLEENKRLTDELEECKRLSQVMYENLYTHNLRTQIELFKNLLEDIGFELAFGTKAVQAAGFLSNEQKQTIGRLGNQAITSRPQDANILNATPEQQAAWLTEAQQRYQGFVNSLENKRRAFNQELNTFHQPRQVRVAVPD